MEKKDREIIRDMAKKQVELANSDEMIKKEQLWYDHNDCKTFDPVVTIEKGTFNREFEHLFEPCCESEDGRKLEYYFHSNMVQYEYIGDDTIMPREFAVQVNAWIKPFGLRVERERRVEKTYAYKLNHPIKDLEADFGILKKSQYGCNYEDTLEYKAKLEDIIGDIMPIKLTFTPCCSLAQNIYSLMGLEVMMVSMYDYPELFHKMMDMLTTDYVEFWGYMEKNNYIHPNNFSNGIPQGSYGFSTELPINKKETNLTLNDVWGYMDSQETSEVSPDMYHEFFFPYYKRISERFGLFNYGCCESVSAIWEKSVSNYENLRKVSISPWCDEEKIGDSLRGKKIIYHRKPFPNFLSVDPVFDQSTFSDHIKKTIKAANGCYLEFSYRDVYSLQGELRRANRAYHTICDCIAKYR